MTKAATFLVGFAMIFLLACEQKSDHGAKLEESRTQQTTDQIQPLAVVNARMDFFNQHDLTAFLKCYHENVKIYTYPSKLLGKGSQRLASIFEADFKERNVHVEIINQITNGAYVINHEIVTRAEKETKYVSIYEVKNGLIASVRFVRD